MSSVAGPYGIQPISSNEGFNRPMRMPNGIVSGLASNIFKYQAVTIDPATGTLKPVTNPGGVPQKVYGVFAGVEFTPLGGRPTESPFWPSGMVFDPAYDMLVYYWPAWIPGTRWKVQADGAVAQALMGSQFNITNPAAGSTSTGYSACTVGAAGVAAGSQGQFALQEFDPGINELIGDAFTDLICTIALPQIGLGSQTSIG
jgi:hypothetical protein